MGYVVISSRITNHTEPHMKGVGKMYYNTFIGLDVHKNQITVAIAEGHQCRKARSLGVIPNTQEAISKVRRLERPVHQLHFCYEAGPCGYGIYRQLIAMGAKFDVIAPSLIPTRPGGKACN